MCIYVITNKINGKQYVGKTERDDLVRRWCEHKSCALRDPKYPLHRSIHKHGAENFVIKVLEEVTDKADLPDKETHYILSLNTLRPNGYNLRIHQENIDRSPEFREIMSKSNQGKAKKKNKTSKFIGVYKYKCGWMTLVTKSRRDYTMSAVSEEDAARNYDRMAIYLYGRSAVLNFHESDYSITDVEKTYQAFVQNTKTSQYKGVDFVHSTDRWRGVVRYPKGTKVRITESEEEAAQFVDIARWIYLKDENLDNYNFPANFSIYKTLDRNWLERKQCNYRTKGVTKRKGKFIARVGYMGKYYSCGHFSTHAEAAHAVEEKKRSLGIWWDFNELKTNG